MTALAYLLIAVFAVPIAFGVLAILSFYGISVFGLFEGAARDIRHAAHHGA